MKLDMIEVNDFRAPTRLAALKLIINNTTTIKVPIAANQKDVC